MAFWFVRHHGNATLTSPVLVSPRGRFVMRKERVLGFAARWFVALMFFVAVTVIGVVLVLRRANP